MSLVKPLQPEPQAASVALAPEASQPAQPMAELPPRQGAQQVFRAREAAEARLPQARQALAPAVRPPPSSRGPLAWEALRRVSPRPEAQ